MKTTDRTSRARKAQAPPKVTSAEPQRAGPVAGVTGPAGLQGAMENPMSASPHALLMLQRLYGNRAVGEAIQRATIGARGGELDNSTHSAIDSARGGGQALDEQVAGAVGGALGADFSGVRVHTDSRADGLNRSLSARAFTTGSDVFFSQGAYQPRTSSGKQLLAHELTHVAQQGSAKPNKLQTQRNGMLQREFDGDLAPMTNSQIVKMLEEKYEGRVGELQVSQQRRKTGVKYGTLEGLATALSLSEKTVKKEGRTPTRKFGGSSGGTISITKPLKTEEVPLSSPGRNISTLPKQSPPITSGVTREDSSPRPERVKPIVEPESIVEPKPRVEPKVEKQEVEGSYTVTGIQGNVNDPADNKRVLRRPGAVTVSGPGGTFIMVPGQDFLNTSLSKYYQLNAIKDTETISVKRRPPQLRTEGQVNGTEADDMFVIGDAHHRFVWSAEVGKTVDLKQVPGVVPPQLWGDMKYGPSKNNLGKAKSTTITEEMKDTYFERWVGQAGSGGFEPGRFVEATIKAHPSTENTPDTIGEYVEAIEKRQKLQAYPVTYDEFVTAVAAAGGKEGKDYEEDLLAHKPPTLPGVLVVDTDKSSRGHYDPKNNVIKLQQNEPVALLDTLRFETGNAERKGAYASIEKSVGTQKEKGYKKAAKEFEVDVDYVAGLLRIYKAGDLDDLVRNKFALPGEYLVKSDYAEVAKKTVPPYIDVPPVGVLPTQSHRQALWHWKTSEWAENNRRHIWIIENHTHMGMGPSDKTYTGQK